MITIRGVKRTKEVSEAVLSDPLAGKNYLAKSEDQLKNQIVELMEQFGFEGEILVESDEKPPKSPQNHVIDQNL